MKRTNQNFRNCLMLFFLLYSLTAFSQTKGGFPTIGRPMPDFTLNDVNYHTKTKISSADLKGKWYILDFWIRSCTPCIASFPKVSKMAQEFKDKVEIIEVGIGGNKEMRQFYEETRKKLGLNMPMAYDDKLAFDWQINSYPHIFIVDDKGILRVITYDISSEQLKSLMNTGADTFPEKTDYKLYFSNDIRKLYFLNNNGGNDTTFLFRSVLAKASPDYSSNGDANFNSEGPNSPFLPKGTKWKTTVNMKNGLFQLSKTNLLTLYNTAYFGQDRTMFQDSLYKKAILLPPVKDNKMYPILEVRDSSDFNYNYDTLQGLYTYSLSIPKEKANRETMMRAMQLDLLKYFGYDARIEIRKMPAVRLVVTNKALVEKLRSKGGDPNTGVYTTTQFHLINGQISAIPNNLFFNDQLGPIYLDDTGIDYKVDLYLECSMNADMNTLRAELQKNGLDLVKGVRDMKVLVIRDPIDINKI